MAASELRPTAPRSIRAKEAFSSARLWGGRREWGGRGRGRWGVGRTGKRPVGNDISGTGNRWGSLEGWGRDVEFGEDVWN